MTNNEFVAKLKKTLTIPTYYVMGGFGARLGLDYINYNYQYNKDHRADIEKHYNTNPLTFGFDCVCLVKSVMFWNFRGDPAAEYGGAKYDKSNDITVSAFKKSCKTISTDFNNIEIGELLFIGSSHVGVYIGNGEVIESTPAWKSGVQRTLLPWRNSTNYEKLPVRAWDTHGKTSYLEYTSPAAVDTAELDTLRQRNRELTAENTKLKEKINAALGVLK